MIPQLTRSEFFVGVLAPNPSRPACQNLGTLRPQVARLDQ